jgi:hypothetical protein
MQGYFCDPYVWPNWSSIYLFLPQSLVSRVHPFMCALTQLWLLNARLNLQLQTTYIEDHIPASLWAEVDRTLLRIECSHRLVRVFWWNHIYSQGFKNLDVCIFLVKIILRFNGAILSVVHDMLIIDTKHLWWISSISRSARSVYWRCS